ncbi:unnamed protein product [Mycetohabitans rhizoxinica HKI 454]|uniref:Uncharacterized protein n=1 Tax=Mycetohabitans rhizoxinica (strain DSM 19002 / CIP 109453 / HKI 454) TaxID=882378 RepID=E5AMN4_MYCRK|nr:unnamed protein product [Mycetohabitans rhizoxinica HKI 454]
MRLHVASVAGHCGLLLVWQWWFWTLVFSHDTLLWVDCRATPARAHVGEATNRPAARTLRPAHGGAVRRNAAAYYVMRAACRVDEVRGTIRLPSAR